jgi:spermidine synthase
MANSVRRIEVLLFLSVFTIATCGLIYELVAGTLASYLLGDSVKQFSFIIGIYLFAMGVGSYMAKFLDDNRLLDKFIEIEILVGLVGGLSSTILFLLFQKAAYFEGLLYFLVFLTGALVGLELPLLMNILQNRVEFKDLVSNVFTFDYIGALLASIAFPLFLVPNLGLIRTSLFFGVLNIVVSITLCYKLRNEVKSFYSLRTKAVFSLLLLIVVFFFSEKILSYSETNLYGGEKVIYAKTSPYQRMVLTRQKEDIRLYLNNNLQFSTRDEYRYHESLVHPTMSKAPAVKRVLILGGGDGCAAREILKYDEVEQVTLVDLDPEMTKLFSQNDFLNQVNKQSLLHSKVKVVNQDAFIWLRNNPQERYDVAIVDFPDPSNYSLGKLYSNAFYQTFTKVLSDSALVVVQSTSPYNAPQSFWCINQTMLQSFRATFPYHVLVPSFGDWGYVMATRQNHFDVMQTKRQVNNLRFYDFNLIPLLEFGNDSRFRETDINQLDNQVLVRYFMEEWGK